MSTKGPHSSPLLLTTPLAQPLKLRIPKGRFGVRRSSSARSLPGPLPDAYEPQRFHSGVDLLAPVNSWVLAAADGTVVDRKDESTGRDPDDARLTVDHHGEGHGLITRYVHLRNVYVSEGDDVSAGEAIATVGNPATWADHLHFEVRRVVNRDDPSTFWHKRNTAPIDPTRELYDWEWKTADRPSTEDPHVLEEAGVMDKKGIHMFQVKWDGEYYHLPLYEPTPAELELVMSLREAYNLGRPVRLAYRDSEFFGERKVVTAARVV